MGRRHRGKDNKKVSTDSSVSDRLKDARHEFQTISQTFPIARQLLLDEIKRLEAESGDDNNNRSAPSVKNTSQKEKASVDNSQSAVTESEADSAVKHVGKVESNVDTNTQNTAGTERRVNTTEKDQNNGSSSLLAKARNENVPDHWDQLSPKDDFSACDELKGNGLHDFPEFSPRGIENEKCSMKIFIPHHEYPGVSCCPASPTIALTLI
jgi:hypothetical protein